MAKNSELIRLHNAEWLQKQKIAGEIAASVVQRFVHAVVPGITLKALEKMAADYIISAGAIPAFQGYRGFPGAVCISVNTTMVHGIPDDYSIKSGDVVTMDVGVNYENVIADTAFTCICGEADPIYYKLLQTCQKSLNNAIQAMAVGKRLGVIGHAIRSTVKNTGFGNIIKYGGHGLDYGQLHTEPFVCNNATPAEGIRIVPGLAIAIEPMLTIDGDISTTVMEDNWSVKTKGISCHFEHSVTVDEDGKIYIITENGMEA